MIARGDSLILVGISQSVLEENRMKRALTLLIAGGVWVALSGTAAAHGNVGFTVSIGAPVYAPPPVVYAPPPVYYTPPPVYYYAPPRVYYGPPAGYYGGPRHWHGHRHGHGHGHGRRGHW